MFRKILVGYDGSVGSKRALEAAINLAKRYDSKLHAVSVEAHLPHYAATIGEVLEELSDKKDYFQGIQKEAAAQAQLQGVTLHTHILPGHEVQAIVEFIKENQMDLLVIGFMGHSRLFDRIWGGTSQNLARLAPCTVLVVK